MILAFSIFLGGVVLALTHANYHPDGVLLVAGLLVGCTLAGLVKSDALMLSPADPVEKNIPVAIAVFFAVLLAQDHELLYASNAQCLLSLRGLTRAAALLSIAAALAAFANPIATNRRVVSLATGFAIACLIAARLMVPFTSPAPFIDVFWINTWAVTDFLAGKNPYSQTYSDIYKGFYGYQPGFTYWPVYLLAASVPGAMKLDLRFLNLLCDVLFAALLAWSCTQSPRTAGMTWPVALLWLAMPVSLFILEQAWVDPLMLLLASGSILALRSGRPNLAALLSGLAAATKQYGFIIPALLAACILGSLGWKSTLRFAVLGGVSFTLPVLPFVVWDFSGFYKNTIQILMVIPMRMDSLTIPAFLSNSFGIKIPGTLLLMSYVGVFAGCLWAVLKRPTIATTCFAATFCYAFLFLMGKQASANYYAIVLGIALLALIERTREKKGSL
jgi:hypothetical protein